MKRFKFPIFLLTILAFSGCDRVYTPKPKGYNRIDLPAHAYQPLPDTLPYRFEYSKHAYIRKDTSWIAEDYWIQVTYPEFNASIEITYKPVFSSDSLLYNYFETAYRLTAQHKKKAYSIEETSMIIPNGDNAIVAELSGEVPSQMQFYTSDSSMHFLRGALYFNTATENDSLKPVIEFVKVDILHLLKTLQWNKDFPLEKLR